MAENKKSFIAYADWKETFDSLPDDKAGQLIKHIFAYVNDENPTSDDLLINAVFINIRNTLKRDLKKWESQYNQRVEAGKKSAEVRKRNAAVVNGRSVSSTVSVNDSVSVNKEKKYTYNAFYDSEILKSTNVNYTNFVKYLFGENMLKEKLVGVLSIKNQLTFDEYKKISDKCEVNKLKLGQILTKIENDVKYYKGKKSLYRTLLNWAEGRFAK